MDQRSPRHDNPPAVNGNITDQQGHHLGVELKALETSVLTCWRLSSTSLAQPRSPVVDPH